MKARWTSAPSAAKSSAQRSSVPGGTVLLRTTTWALPRTLTAAAISAHTRMTYSRSGSPLASGGVPTVIIETSVAPIAARASVVASTRPSATALASRPSSPSSTIGERPAATPATLSALTSTPITRWPSRARHAAVTAPT